MLPRVEVPPSLGVQSQTFLDALKTAGFKGDIHNDYSTRLVAATDNSIYQVLPDAVLFPKHQEDIQCILKCANQDIYKDIIFSPRGGGTGTNGQSLCNGIVIDTSRHMSRILEINVEKGWARVQPGVVLDQLNEVLAKDDVFFAPSLSPSNRATLGGMVNTDACGKGSRIYGRTSNHILELDIVLIDGSHQHLASSTQAEIKQLIELDNKFSEILKGTARLIERHRFSIQRELPKLRRFLTGYNLNDLEQDGDTFNLCPLICGSEGSLAVVSEIKLKLSPLPEAKQLIAVHYAQFDDALRGARELVEHNPAAIETIDDRIISLARSDTIWHKVAHLLPEDESRPIRAINLIEFTAPTEKELESIIKTFCKSLDKDIPDRIIRYTIANTANDIAALWELRKKGVGLLGNTKGERRPVPFVEDTAVPPEHLADYIEEFREILERHGLSYGMFGHVDVGCLHVRPALDIKQETDEKLIRQVSDEVCALVQKYGGVMWAEHGRGYRSEYTERFFGRNLYKVLREIKELFDPDNRFNPGKIVTPISMEDNIKKLDEVPMRGQFDRQVPAELREQFSSAMVCNGNGACFNYDTHDVMCPSMKVTNNRIHSPKGRAGLMREWLRLLSSKDEKLAQELTHPSQDKPFWKDFLDKFNLSFSPERQEKDFSHEVYETMNECLSCKACSSTCPIKVDIPDLKSRFLSLYHRRYFRPLKDYFVASAENIAYLSSLAPGFFKALLKSPLHQSMVKHVAHLIDAPLPSQPSLESILSKQGIKPFNIVEVESWPKEKLENCVVLLQDTFTSFYEAEVVESTIQLLGKLGYKVLLAPWFSNGKPMHIKGFLHSFRKKVEKNSLILKRYSALGLPMLGIEPSIVLTYREEYEQIGISTEYSKIHLLQEWLNDKLKDGRFRDKWPSPQSSDDKTVLFSHCSEQASHPASGKEWTQIFENLGFSLTALRSGCCGMAGTYGHETEHESRSKDIFELSWQRHIDFYSKEKATFLATGFSCRHQVERLKHQRFMHPCQWLNQSISP